MRLHSRTWLSNLAHSAQGLSSPTNHAPQCPDRFGPPCCQMLVVLSLAFETGLGKGKCSLSYEYHCDVPSLSGHSIHGDWTLEVGPWWSWVSTKVGMNSQVVEAYQGPLCWPLLFKTEELFFGYSLGPPRELMCDVGREIWERHQHSTNYQQ